MDAPCKIQGSIHVFRLVNNMCPGKWVHITTEGLLYMQQRRFYQEPPFYYPPLFKVTGSTGKIFFVIKNSDNNSNCIIKR